MFFVTTHSLAQVGQSTPRILKRGRQLRINDKENAPSDGEQTAEEAGSGADDEPSSKQRKSSDAAAAALGPVKSSSTYMGY